VRLLIAESDELAPERTPNGQTGRQERSEEYLNSLRERINRVFRERSII
jgi:hypothetical protein